MTVPLVVLTYPGHFVFTKLTCRSYLKYHTQPSNIVIVVDDCSPWTWDTYVEDCQEFYKEFNPRIVTTSDHPIINQFRGNSWLRQQMIKMYLDTMIDSESWFFTDGDIVFLNAVEPDTVPYSFGQPSREVEPNQNYVSNLLGLDNFGFEVDGQKVCVSDPAFRTMHANILKDIRNYIENRTGQSFEDINLALIRQDTSSVSEWELIEHYKYHVRGIKPHLIKYAPHDFTHTKYDLNFFSHQFITCYCTDAGIGQQWYLDQGIIDFDRYWHKLQQIKK